MAGMNGLTKSLSSAWEAVFSIVDNYFGLQNKLALEDAADRIEAALAGSLSDQTSCVDTEKFSSEWTIEVVEGTSYGENENKRIKWRHYNDSVVRSMTAGARYSDSNTRAEES